MKRLVVLAAVLFGCGLGAALAFVWALVKASEYEGGE